MKNHFFLFIIAINFGLAAQVDNTIYGINQIINPPSFQFGSIDPLTGQITNIGSAILSNTVNSSGASLNPYNQTFSYQDEDSWLSIDLQTGAVLNDVMVNLPNTAGSFDNFKFNAADSNMYGLYNQLITDPVTGFITLDLKLATCDLTTGNVNLISPTSVAQSYTMSGSTIDPHLMVYYFESEGKFMGLDLYNGQIYSQPNISLAVVGSSFGNYAYSCADTAVYGLIMLNGVEALGKINPQTGVVTALPTALNFNNYIMNSGGAIDPVNLVYYFQTIDTTGQIKIVGLSLLDGSVASQNYISSNGDYFIMYRIQSDCYEANILRLNPMSFISENKDSNVEIYPNPAQDFLNLISEKIWSKVEIMDAFGNVVRSYYPNDSNFHIPIDFLANGIYYLRISSNDTSFIERFIRN
jgi:hypothetical protein